MTTTITTTTTSVVVDACDVIFEDDFSLGNFSRWTATDTYGSGTATIVGGEAIFNCPNGNNNGSPPPQDEAVARLNLSGEYAWPAGGVLWAKCRMKFIGADTSISFGGGFFMEYTVGIELDANFVNRWNVEFYSAAQEFDDPDPYNGELPIKVCGTEDDGAPRLHGTLHTWISPDTWYEVWLKVDYSGTNPSATWYLDGVEQDTLVDTSVLSVNATKPSYFRVGSPWYDSCVKLKVYIDDVVLQETSFA